MQNKPIPKYDRNDFICPNCNTLSHNTHIKFQILARNYDCDFEENILLFSLDSSKPYEYSFEKFENNFWNNILVNHKKKKANKMSEEQKIMANLLYAPYIPYIEITLKICNNCGNKLLWENDANIDKHRLSNQNLINFEIDEPNEYMPNDLKEIYNEARSISNLSPRSASALLRYLLEQLFIRKFSTLKTKSLSEMLDDSTLKSELGNSLIKVGDSIRQIANKSIHTSEIDINELTNNINLFFEWINSITNVLFQNYEEIAKQSEEIRKNITKK